MAPRQPKCRVLLCEGYELELWELDIHGVEFILTCPVTAGSRYATYGAHVPITERQAEFLLHDEVHPKQLDYRFNGLSAT